MICIETEATGELFALNMTNGDGEGVGGVTGLGEFVQVQKGAHHHLHLLFVSVAIAGDAGLHFAGRIGIDGDAVLLGREEDDTADFGEAQSGAHVQGGENGFDGHGGGLKLFDQLAKQGMDVLQASAGRGFTAFRGHLKRAIAKRAEMAAVGFDDAIARGAGGSGVNAEDPAEARRIGRTAMLGHPG